MDHDKTWGLILLIWTAAIVPVFFRYVLARRDSAGSETATASNQYERAAGPWIAVIVIALAAWKFGISGEWGILAIAIAVPIWLYWQFLPNLRPVSRKNAGLSIAALSASGLAVFFLANDAIETIMPDGEGYTPYDLFVDRWGHAVLAMGIIGGFYVFLRSAK